MSRPRMTSTELTLSGQGQLKKTRYSSYNLVPGTVLPKDIRINPPKHYEKETKKAFKVISRNLIAMGALSEQDLPSFSLMMDCLDDYYKLSTLLVHLDTTIRDKDEFYFKTRDKLMKRKAEAMRNFYLWTGKFGTTPVDRTRLTCEDPLKEEQDPLDIILES